MPPSRRPVPPSGSLAGLVALVSGGAQGIGAAISRHLVEQGAAVFILDTDRSAGATTAAELTSLGGPAVRFRRTDVTQEASVRAACQACARRFGGLDILVNNAGITEAAPLEEISGRMWDRIMAVNLKGPFLLTKHAIPLLRRSRRGRIINISSIAAIIGGGFVGTAHYAASKAGLIALTKAAAKQLGPLGITVNAIAPGAVRTRMSQGWVSVREAEVAATIPVRRIGEPADIATAVCYLASAESGYVSGHVLIVDGGTTIGSARSLA